jgi:hypothetical protein
MKTLENLEKLVDVRTENKNLHRGLCTILMGAVNRETKP